MELDRCRTVRWCGLLGGTYNDLSSYRQFLGVFSKLQKASSYLSVCMEQCSSEWTDFHEIWHSSNFKKPVKKVQVYVISGSRHEVDENCTLLGYYTVRSGNFLSTFLDNHLLGSRNPVCCPKTGFIQERVWRCKVSAV